MKNAEITEEEWLTVWDLTSVLTKKINAITQYLGMNMDVRKEIQEVRNPDSMTVGTPSVGQIKVYGDFSNEEEFKQKIDNAKELLIYAKAEDD